MCVFSFSLACSILCVAVCILVLMTDNTSTVHTLERDGSQYWQPKIHSFKNIFLNKTGMDFISEPGSRISVALTKNEPGDNKCGTWVVGREGEVFG